MSSLTENFGGFFFPGHITSALNCNDEIIAQSFITRLDIGMLCRNWARKPAGERGDTLFSGVTWFHEAVY